MALVTKPGGFVLLQHYRNEAKHNGYAGLHQWNLSVKAGHLLVTRPTMWGAEIHNVAHELADVLELVSTAAEHDEPKMDFVVFRRREL